MISLLVPYQANGGFRQASWEWLKRYWVIKLPEAEIVMGRYKGVPFSKAAALNDAAKRARGDILVLIDSDCYMDPAVLRRCASAISESLKPLWFIPYAQLFRLTPEASARLLGSDPANPMKLWGNGLPRHLWEESTTNQFGAMVQVLSREAWDTVGGWDERFIGWGGEDGAAMRAVDTLYAPHSTTRNSIYHLWHEHPGTVATRVWPGQDAPRSNFELIRRYRLANGHPRAMRRLLEERDAKRKEVSYVRTEAQATKAGSRRIARRHDRRRSRAE